MQPGREFLVTVWHLDEGVSHVQALIHAERRGDAFPASDQGARGQTHHHVLRVHLQQSSGREMSSI